jgi:hypothetical protein
MYRNRIAVAVIALFAFFTTACNNGTNTDAAYKAAINAHYRAVNACIWSQSKKFPVQAGTSDDAKTEGYDALTDAGLLKRSTAEKKIIIISKQVTNYDLSYNGRSVWTPDTSQPGYGNFCYGNREVTSIDSSTPGTNASGAKTVTVAYHYKIANVPGWANSAEMKTAYPDMAAALNGTGTDTATLTQTGDRWEFTK